MNKEEQLRNINDQLIEQGKLDIVEKFFIGDYVAHADGRDYKGHEFIRRFINQLRSALPDITVLNIEAFADAGDTIAWQRTFQGTHKRDMMGIPPSNRKIKWNEMVISRFEDNKIAEEWVVSELAGQLLLKQSKPKIANPR